MGTEPTTFRMLGHLWADLTIASRSHIMSSEHTILTASRSRVNTL